MATKVAITLRKAPNKAGLFPLTIRITINRYPTYRQFGKYIELKDWDEKNKEVKSSHPDSEDLNEFMLEELLKAKKEFKTDGYSSPVKPKKKVRKSNNYFDSAERFLDALRAKEDWDRLTSEQGYVNYLKKYYKHKVLPFENMDASFLKKFKYHLKNKLNLKETSALNVLVQIRTIFNGAIANGLAKEEDYPFGKGKNKIKIKFPETSKIGWTKEEIVALTSLTDLTEGEQHALNIWIYAFSFAGMRISDVLNERWNHYNNGRLYYNMGKNNKLVSLKVPDRVPGILKQYEHDKKSNNDFIFPEMKKANFDDKKDVLAKKKTATKKINRYLKKLAARAGIEKKLTTHIARHSFGLIAGEKIHPKKLQKLYRHKDLNTTLNYQANFIHSEVDEALDSVINF